MMGPSGTRVRPLDLPYAAGRSLESTERFDSNLRDPEVDVRAPGPDDDVTFTVEEACGPGEFLAVHRAKRRPPVKERDRLLAGIAALEGGGAQPAAAVAPNVSVLNRIVSTSVE